MANVLSLASFGPPDKKEHFVMNDPLKVVHFVNQFFGGIGGEEQANRPVTSVVGPIGPGRPLQRVMGTEAAILGTIICGDNYASESTDATLAEVRRLLELLGPDVVIAGPAFDAGRYGLACGMVGKLAADMGIPAVTAMHPENPGVQTYRRDVTILPTGASGTDMQRDVSALAAMALKLGRGDALGSPTEEGYISHGIRELTTRGQPGFVRALDMLTAKLRSEPFESEVPYHKPESVEPAPPVTDLSNAKFGLISTGGLIPKGNPDRQTSGNPDRYYTYSVEGMQALTGDDWEAFHGGYYNQIASDNPNYILPLSFMRQFEADGVVGSLHTELFTMPGVGTPVEKSRRMGELMAREIADAGIDACILVAT